MSFRKPRNGKSSIEIMAESRGPVWTTQNGREIPIDDINDSHLINIINKIRRDVASGVVKSQRETELMESYDGDMELVKELMQNSHKKLKCYCEAAFKAPGHTPCWDFEKLAGTCTPIEDPDGLGPWHALAMYIDRRYKLIWENEVVKRGGVIIDNLKEDGGEDPCVE